MDRLKKFLNEKKTDKTFKKAGAGHRLTESSTPAETSQSAETSNQPPLQITSAERVATADMAAQAAFKRMNLGAKQETAAQRSIRMQALKELEKEQKEQKVAEVIDNNSQIRKAMDEREFEHSGAIEGIYYTCELLGDVKFKKNEMKERIEEFLRSQLPIDAVIAASLMIFSLNTPSKYQIASKTIQTYIRNIIERPEEVKFRRIRFGNKAFQERVFTVKGGVEFLKACGFEEMMVRAEDGSLEPVLLIREERVHDMEYLVQALDVLQTHKPVPLKLCRNPVVYHLEPKQIIKQPKLPVEFYDLDAAEIKKEQKTKEEETEKLTTLRTREMRERDEVLRTYRYKYTLLRVKFPSGYLLQGIFGCHEHFEAARQFVQEFLAKVEPPLFLLKDPVNGKPITDDAKSFAELNLAPTVLLHFEWDSDVYQALARTGNEVPYLDQRHMDHAERLVGS